MPFTQQQGLAIPFHFWRNSRTYFKILKFSLKSSPVPGSFIRRAHPLCISSVTHPFTSRLHGPTAHCGLQKSSPQRRQAKAETQGGLEHDEWNWWCSPLLIHHPVSEPHLPYPHSLYAPREGESGKVCRERQQPLLQRSSTGKLHKCTGMTTVIAAYLYSFRVRKIRIVPGG